MCKEPLTVKPFLLLLFSAQGFHVLNISILEFAVRGHFGLMMPETPVLLSLLSLMALIISIVCLCKVSLHLTVKIALAFAVIIISSTLIWYDFYKLSQLLYSS